MRIISLLHRWTGGIIGVLLAVLGLSGSLLVWKDTWLHLTVPGANSAVSVTPKAAINALDTMLQAADDMPVYVVFPGNGINLHTVSTGRESGFYADATGTIIERWQTLSDRFELWLFDLHHHLLIGGEGEIIAGIAGLIGIAFIITGVVLWWRTRRQFKLRLWPNRMLRPAIIQHHRDIGIVAAPLMTLVMLSGAMMALRPVAGFVLSPLSSPSETSAALAPPAFQSRASIPAPQEIDWRVIINTAYSTFPNAEMRLVIMPSARNPMVSVRMKLPSEWLPNGRTLLWFDPATANLVEARSAETHPAGLKVYNTIYPLHAARVGGLIYKIAVSLTGIILTLLGSLAVWSFWRHQSRKPKH